MASIDGYHHGNLRRALLDEAFLELERDGLEALSLREIALAAGVSKSAPYRHFASKHELLVAMAADGFRLFAERLEASVAASASMKPLEGLRNLAAAYVDFAKGQPALYRLMFSRFGYSLHSEACRANSQRAMGCLMTAVARAQETGWKREQDGQTLVLSIWAQVHGVATLIIDALVPEWLGLEAAESRNLFDTILG
jgi:AcrR family transcriptional regulator